MKGEALMQLVAYFFASLLLSLALVPLMRPLAYRVGALDRAGEGRKIHWGVKPRLGGVGIFLSFMLPLGFFILSREGGAFHGKLLGIVVSSMPVFLIGLYDDIKCARVRHKLLVEVLAATMLYAWGIRITAVTNPLGGIIHFGWLSLPVTVLWVVAITNAMNLIDGLDGLAAGTGILISLTLFFLSAPDAQMQTVYILLVGSLLGFLKYNFSPALIYMGDSGSLFLGFFLASFAIVFSHKTTAVATMMVPLIVFSHPLMDTTYAFLRRLYRGLPVGRWDEEHIHHKLLEMGVSKGKVVLLIYLVNAAIMLTVLLIINRQLNVDFLALVLFAGLFVAGLRLLGYIRFVPFIRDVKRNFEEGRRQRYASYIVRRFRKNASMCGTLGALRPHLESLAAELELESLEVRLDNPDRNVPVFCFEASDASGESVAIAFPLVRGEKRIGDITLTKQMGSPLPGVSELVFALSEEIGRLAEEKADRPEG